MTEKWFVAVYAVSREYGGAEEGGWYFDAGELVKEVEVATEDEAEELRERLRDEYPDTGKSSSVLGGEDYRISIDTEPHEKLYPAETPRYE